MSDTTNLQLPLLEAAQAQKHVTVNETIQALDLLVQLTVLDRDLSTPPETPVDGDRYIVASSATDEWEAHETHIAAWQDGAWVFHVPRTGWRAWAADEGRALTFDGTRWSPGGIVTANGAATTLGILEEEHTLAAAATSDTAIEIPDHSLVLGVTCIVIEEVTGATSFDVGIAGDTQRYGNTIGTAVNDQCNGIAEPAVHATATPVRFTANGGNFTAGKLAVAIHYLQLQVPTFL